MIPLQIGVAHPSGQCLVVIFGSQFLTTDTGLHLQRHRTRMQMERLLGQHLSETFDEHRQDVESQLLCQIEGTTLEQSDSAVFRTCSLREYHHRVTFINLLPDLHFHIIHIRDGEEIRITDNETVKGIMPHPALREDDQFRCQHHNRHQIQMRLMVADDDRGIPEVFALWLMEGELRTGHMTDNESGMFPQKPVIQELVFLRCPSDGDQQETCQRQDNSIHEEEAEGEDGIERLLDEIERPIEQGTCTQDRIQHTDTEASKPQTPTVPVQPHSGR